MSENLSGLIDYSEAEKLHQNWLKHKEIYSEELGHEESFEVNFSTRAVRVFKICNRIFQKSRLDNPGIRILFGAYKEGENPAPNIHKTSATVVLVPTEKTQLQVVVTRN